MKELAEIFKALGDPIRLDIVKLLMGKELCVCHILDAFDVSQPTISHHLKTLKYAGVVTDKRQGKWIYYSLNPATLESANACLEAVVESSKTKQCSSTCLDEVGEE